MVCGFESRRSFKNKTLTAAWQTTAIAKQQQRRRRWRIKNSSMVENARLYHHNALKIALLFAFYVSIMRFRCVLLSSSSSSMSILFFTCCLSNTYSTAFHCACLHLYLFIFMHVSRAKLSSGARGKVRNFNTS